MIRLSICIATLNRAAFLAETLDCLLEQATDDVEIVIVDGASTDGTDRLVAERFAGRERCVYRRLAQKGGVDRDYCRAVEEASGEFCWLMTDDDLPVPGAVQKVLAQLRSDVDLVLVNAEVANVDLSATLILRKMPLAQDRTFGPGEQAELFALAGDLTSFIGSVVVRRATWLARDAASYFGTEFVHVGVLFQKPLERQAIAIAEPLVRIRYGNAQWSTRAYEIWMFKWPTLVWSFAHLPDSAKARVTPPTPYRSLVATLLMKARGCFTWSTYRTQLANRPLGWLRRPLFAALAACPETLFNLVACLIATPLRRWCPGVALELRSSPYYWRRSRP